MFVCLSIQWKKEMTCMQKLCFKNITYFNCCFLMNFCSIKPRYSRFCYSRTKKQGEIADNKGKNTNLGCFRHKMKVLVFTDSKFLGNVTPANSEGNLYIKIANLIKKSIPTRCWCMIFIVSFSHLTSHLFLSKKFWMGTLCVDRNV